MANSGLCSIPGCDKPARLRGWCSMHHTRWLRYGDFDTVKKAANGAVKQYVSDVVLLHASDECLIWPFSKDRAGRARINGFKTTVASRAICEEVYGPPPSPKLEAAHSCGNGHLGCVNPRHLRWASRKENKDDEVVHGTRNLGERNGQARLTEGDVRQIRRLIGTMPQHEIADLYGIHQVQVSKINKRQVWGWLD